MRVALIGWEIDDLVAGCLARLGTEVIAFTRWFPGMEVREQCGGWVKLRCPHEIGGALADEAAAFRESVVCTITNAGLDSRFDVIHALDSLARPAAWALRERSSVGVTVGSVSVDDLQPEARIAPEFDPDTWICGNPWVAERWRGAAPPGVSMQVIPGRPGSSEPSERMTAGEGNEDPSVAFWVPREASIDPEGVVAAMSALREGTPALSAVVLGDGTLAQAVRARLSACGWLGRRSRAACESTLEHWQYWLTHASVVAIASNRPGADPVAYQAWMAGNPVVRIDSADPHSMAGAIREALYHSGSRQRDVKAGAALAARAIEPSSVAEAWIRVYLDALLTRSTAAPDGPAALPIQTGRTRLSLTAVSPRELYAAWSVAPADWLTALEWIGLEGARAALALRLHDVTDIRFHGDNAHGFRDIELGPDDRHRLVSLDSPGRSFAGSVGVRTPGGFFQPIAHAPLCHLPREGLAPHGLPERRVGVLRRR